MTKDTDVDSYRKSVTERLIKLETLPDRVEKLGNHLEDFVEEIGKWRATLGRPNWPVIIGLVSATIASTGVGVVVLLASLSAFWFMINAQVLNISSPIRQDLAAAQAQIRINTSLLTDNIVPTVATLGANAASSIQDRLDIKDKVSLLQARIFEDAGNIRATTEKLKEVETQFHSNSEMRSVQVSAQERQNAVMTNAIHSLGATLPEYPRAPFYTPDNPLVPKQ